MISLQNSVLVPCVNVFNIHFHSPNALILLFRLLRWQIDLEQRMALILLDIHGHSTVFNADSEVLNMFWFLQMCLQTQRGEECCTLDVMLLKGNMSENDGIVVFEILMSLKSLRNLSHVQEINRRTLSHWGPEKENGSKWKVS